MNQIKPLKYILAAAAILVALLIAAYLMRTTLISRSANMLLASADVRVLQLGTLRLGWSDLYVDQLVLGVGPEDARQTLHGVSLGFSVFEFQPGSLTIERAVLNLPQPTDEAGSKQPQLLLSELLDMLFKQPLQSLAVGQLEIMGLTHPLLAQPLSFNTSISERSITLQGSDRNKSFVLDLQRVEPKLFLLSAKVSADDDAVIDFTLRLNQKQDTSVVEGEGELLVSAGFRMLKSALQIQDIFVQGTGQVHYQFSGEFEDDLLQWEATRGTIALMSTAPLRAKLENQELSASLELLMAKPARVSLQPGASQSLELLLALDAASIKLSEANHSIQGNVDLSGVECSVFSALSCHGGLSARMNALHWDVPIEPAVALVDAQLNISAQFSLEDSVLSVKISPEQWLRAESVVQDGMVFSGPALIGDSQGNFNFDITSGAMNLDVASLRFLVPRAELPELNLATVLQLQKLTLSGDGGSAFDASVHISSKALNIQVPQLWLPALAFEADMIVTDKMIGLDGSVRDHGQQPLLHVEADYNLSEQRGRARLYTKGLDFNADEKRLSNHFSSWPFEWDVLAGSVVLDSTVQWQLVGAQFDIIATIKQDMNGIAAVYQDLGIVGLAADIGLQFQSPNRLKTTQAATISADSVDVGVAIEAIEAKIRFDSDDQSIALDSVEAKLFGGRVWVEEAVYHADQSHNKLFVGVDGIQLNQLLQHAGYDAVQATGSISGLLPLVVNNAGATMKRGMLAAKAPGGVFRYRAEVTTDIDSTVAPVLAALENYHYDVFQLEADYLDDGELQLDMIFRGSNPQVQQGRPIHLNLNVTDNIPALLKSLQSGRRIAETVEKKLGGG